MAYDFSDIKALVVEDSVHMRRLLRSMLNGLGIREVHEATNGADALALIKQAAFDLVLTDWEMPIINGLELTRLIRDETSECPYVPIIMITAHGERDRVLTARDNGIHEYLVKPISAKQLYLRIENCIVNPRRFIRTETYFGPDRRRFQHPTYEGGHKRHDDIPLQQTVDQPEDFEVAEILPERETG